MAHTYSPSTQEAGSRPARVTLLQTKISGGLSIAHKFWEGSLFVICTSHALKNYLHTQPYHDSYQPLSNGVSDGSEHRLPEEIQ